MTVLGLSYLSEWLTGRKDMVAESTLLIVPGFAHLFQKQIHKHLVTIGLALFACIVASSKAPDTPYAGPWYVVAFLWSLACIVALALVYAYEFWFRALEKDNSLDINRSSQQTLP